MERCVDTSCSQAVLLPYRNLSFPFPTVPSANTWRLSDSWCVLKSITAMDKWLFVGNCHFCFGGQWGHFFCDQWVQLLNAANTAFLRRLYSGDWCSQWWRWPFQIQQRPQTLTAGSSDILCAMEKCENARGMHTYNQREKYLHENRLFLSYASS